jgi:hypothetical protein
MLAVPNHRHDYLPGNRQCTVPQSDGRLARVVGFLDKVPGGATAND